jgi:hypothetical protein
MSQEAHSIEIERKRLPTAGGFSSFNLDPDPDLALVARHLGAQLRSFYGAVLHEPFPERLEALARELDRPDQKGL